jgi:hypothetical protein
VLEGLLGVHFAPVIFRTRTSFEPEPIEATRSIRHVPADVQMDRHRARFSTIPTDMVKSLWYKQLIRLTGDARSVIERGGRE